MPTSIREFNIGLYREHLEDASFLYEQRSTYLNDPEVDWPDIGSLEDRLEAHLDALIVGGEVALGICGEQARAGDAGELHAALRILCRQGQREDLFAILETLDPAEESKVRGAAEALCREMPARWHDEFLRVAQRSPQLVGLVARVLGYRRFPAEEVLGRALSAKPPLGRADLAWGMGRIGTATSIKVLWPLLQDDDESVCEAAAIALLRLGDDRLLDPLVAAAPSRAWARRVLALAGDSTCLPVLLDVIRTNPGDADAVMSLGLLGDLGAVPPLLDLLGNEESAGAAAGALNTITGAQLHARVFIPDRFDPDELMEDERRAYEELGTVPERQGQPLGNWERRPLLDMEGWRSWLEQNRHRFSRQHRWRMGRPAGPAALVECLECATTPFAVRRATYEELVIRYGLDVPYEPDLPVRHQWRILERIRQWSTSQIDTFDEGRWSFAGQIQR